MAFTALLRHQWAAMLRSPSFSKNLALNILLGFLFLYFLAIFTLLGIASVEIIGELFPEREVIAVFHSGILYYLLIDLLMRFYLQSVPTLSIKPYLHLPVSRGTLAGNLLWRTVPNLFNLVPLLLLVPFAVRVVADVAGAGGAIAWLAGLYLLAMANNFLAVWLKRQLMGNTSPVIVAGLLLVLTIAADALGHISLADVSQALFAYLLQVPVVFYAFALLTVATVLLCRQQLLSRLYLDEGNTRSAAMYGANLSFMERFGEVGTHLVLEFRMILRNKRMRSQLISVVFFLFYGFMFYTGSNAESGFSLLFAGMIILGMFMFNHGQFMLAWESSFFDRMLTVNTSPEMYYRSKMWLYVVTSTVIYLLSLLYGFMLPKVVFTHTALFLFNIGFNMFVLMLASTHNRSRMDINGSAFFNFEGVSITQFLVVVPLILVPIGTYKLCELAGNPDASLWILAGTGIAGLVFHKYLLQLVCQQFRKKKYQVAAGFRRED